MEGTARAVAPRVAQQEQTLRRGVSRAAERRWRAQDGLLIQAAPGDCGRVLEGREAYQGEGSLGVKEGGGWQEGHIHGLQEQPWLNLPGCIIARLRPSSMLMSAMSDRGTISEGPQAHLMTEPMKRQRSCSLKDLENRELRWILDAARTVCCTWTIMWVALAKSLWYPEADTHFGQLAAHLYTWRPTPHCALAWLKMPWSCSGLPPS